MKLAGALIFCKWSPPSYNNCANARHSIDAPWADVSVILVGIENCAR
jgi:hypothetical protein